MKKGLIYSRSSCWNRIPRTNDGVYGTAASRKQTGRDGQHRGCQE